MSSQSGFLFLTLWQVMLDEGKKKMYCHFPSLLFQLFFSAVGSLTLELAKEMDDLYTPEVGKYLSHC